MDFFRHHIIKPDRAQGLTLGKIDFSQEVTIHGLSGISAVHQWDRYLAGLFRHGFDVPDPGGTLPSDLLAGSRTAGHQPEETAGMSPQRHADGAGSLALPHHHYDLHDRHRWRSHHLDGPQQRGRRPDGAGRDLHRRQLRRCGDVLLGSDPHGLKMDDAAKCTYIVSINKNIRIRSFENLFGRYQRSHRIIGFASLFTARR